MVPILRASSLFLFFSSAWSFTPCPLLGPSFPPFTLDPSDKVVGSALKNLTARFDNLTKSSTGSHGDISPKTTFSIALFSSDDGSAEDKPFFWDYHHTAPVLKEKSSSSNKDVRNTTDDSIYRIGGLTHVFTLWSLLNQTADQHIFDDPVSKHLPELVNKDSAKDDVIGHVQWEDITVGQLASHMAGVARDYCSSDLTSQKNAPKAGLPPRPAYSLPCCGENSKCSTSDFLKHISGRMPVAAPGASPSYSNLAFQLLGYIVEKQAKKPFNEVLEADIFKVLELHETSVFAPKDSSKGIIPVSKEASGWSTRFGGDEASISMFSSVKDMAIAGKAILNSELLSQSQTNRWLKPATFTSNPANTVGYPWVIYTDSRAYPQGPVINTYTVLSNEGDHESLYSSYLGLVPDYGVGFIILSADTEKPADLNAHADIIGDELLEALIKSSLLQATENFRGGYAAPNKHLNSSISVKSDKLPGLFVEDIFSNGTNFRDTLAQLTGVKKSKDLSIRLYPTQLVEKTTKGSKQAFRAVLQDKTESADGGTPTCVSWLDLDKFQYAGRGLDEFIFTLDKTGHAVSVEIPALQVILDKKK